MTSDEANVSRYVLGMNGSNFKASISSKPDGVVCNEEMPLGLKASIAYVVVGRDQLLEEQGGNREGIEEASTLAPHVQAAKQQLFLIEENTVTALKPAMSLLKWKDGPTLKTKNLLRVLESLGRNGMDVLSALADLNTASAAVEVGVLEEKAKDD